MDVRLTVVILALIGPAISQKLFFKSLKEDLQQNKEISGKLTVKDSVVPCPGGKSACADGNTCCMLITRAFGCCALPNATCCLDGRHCCPKGLKCDLGRKACISVSEDIVIPWTETQLRKEIEQEVVKAVQCDEFHQCPTGNTCCKLPTGQWGCCPKPDAVCCNDHLHCCPQGSTCDIATKQCHTGDLKIDWLDKKQAVTIYKQDGEPATEIDLGAKESNERLDVVRCDKTYKCENGRTCCKLASGSWGCCPIPRAVCCSDHVHCCPHGTTCDVSTAKCNKGNLQIDWFVKEPAVAVGKNVMCDKHTECNEGQTCCKLASGQWGCCPIPNAVCCSDEIHCCPANTKCDVSSGKCERGNLQLDWYKKEESLSVGKVQCDDMSYCEDGHTCCKTAGGQWGCCPLPRAVCCQDHVHCCPEDTTCDVAEGKCNRGNLKIDWFTKHKSQTVPSVKSVADMFENLPSMIVGNVKCDDTHFCKDGYTCCLLAASQWGCCPLPNAVCCDDHVHCCPSGHTCDVSTGTCNQQSANMEPIDWVEKVPALKTDVMCDSTHYCPSGKTCCKLASGQWGCCPLPNAVCCSDHVHCCPSGTTCDVAGSKCDQGPTKIDWFLKEEARVIIQHSEPVYNQLRSNCDEPGECQNDETCCKSYNGVSGCCPLPNAVCCLDGEHCCPAGYVCDAGTCSNGNVKMNWYSKQPSIQPADKGSVDQELIESFQSIDYNVLCDDTTECPSGQTCCKLTSGQWGCCPLPKAVCCSDGQHCCPHGYSCDASAGTCSKGNIKVEWYSKQAAISSVSKSNAVICPDGSECQDRQTCCPMYEETYGCCPMPHAVCCSDGEHCCPQGYECDVSHGTCILDMHSIDWSNMTSNKQTPLQEDKTANNRVVNPDQVATGNVIHLDRVGKGHVVGVKKVGDGEMKDGVVPCEGTSQGCPDTYTCCLNNQAEYECCPFHNAFCCPDHIHCCPHGYICDEEPGICRIPETKPGHKLLNKIYAKKRSSLQ